MQQAHWAALPLTTMPLANCLINKHLNHWHYICKDGSEKCLICHNASQDKPRNAKDYPILKKIGLKLVKHSLADTNTASCIGNGGPPPAQLQAQVTAPPPSDNGGFGTAPGAFTSMIEPNRYNPGNNFDYKGKHEGKVYDPSTKPSLATYLYLPIPSNLCLQVSV
jgi:hypothetical protein